MIRWFWCYERHNWIVLLWLNKGYFLAYLSSDGFFFFLSCLLTTLFILCRLNRKGEYHMFDSMRVCVCARMYTLYIETGMCECGWKKETIDVQIRLKNENNVKTFNQNNVYIYTNTRAHIHRMICMCLIWMYTIFVMICLCACVKLVRAHVIFRQFLLENLQCQPIEYPYIRKS